MIQQQGNQPEPAPEELLKFINQLTGRLRVENTLHNANLHAKALTNEMMYRGQQFGRVDLEGQWRNYNRTKGDPRHTHNLYGGYSDSITSSHCLSKTDLEVLPLPADDADDHVVGKARFASHYIDYCEHMQLTETFRLRESKLRQFGGGVFRYSYWDSQAGLSQIKRPRMEDQRMQLGQGAFTCASCGESGPSEMLGAGAGQQTGAQSYDESGMAVGGSSGGRDSDGAGAVFGGQEPPLVACPYCGSGQVQVTEVPQESMPQATGYDSVPSGDGRTKHIPVFQIDYDRTGFDFYEATWVRWQQRFRPEVVQELCPWWKKPPATGMPGDETDSGLKSELTLRNAPGNTQANFGQKGSRTTQGGPQAAQLITCEIWWLQPCLYNQAPAVARKVKLGDPQNPSVTIEVGERLKDRFKKGMYILMFDRKPVDFWDETFLDRLVYIPYKLIPSKIEGDGIENMNEPQRAINLVRSLIMTDIKSNAAPPTLYRPTAIKGGQWSGKPQENVPVDNWPANQSLEGVVYTPQGREMPAHVYGYDDKLSQEMQWDAKATPTNTGAAMLSQGVGERTATGARLMSQGAAAQRAPENALMSDGDERWARQQLKLFRENATDARYIPLQGKSTGMEGLWLKGDDVGDIENELLIVARPGSNVPMSDDDKQQAYGAALQLCGGPHGVLQLAQAAPELLAAIEDVFKIKFKVSQFDLDARQSRFRLDAMRRALPQAQQMAEAMGDPRIAIAFLLQSAPIQPEADNLPAGIKWLQDWTKEDEGLNADPLLFQAAIARIGEIKQAIVGVAQEESQAQVAAQGPAMQAQQEQEAQGKQQEQAGQQQQQESQQQQQQAQQQQDAAGSAAQQDNQNARAVDMSERDHQHSMELSQQDHKQAMEIAKLKSAKQRE